MLLGNSEQISNTFGLPGVSQADGSRLCSVLGAFDGSAFDGSFIAASNTAMYSACICGDGQRQTERHGAVKPQFNEPL